jgi:hypothetical protein
MTMLIETCSDLQDNTACLYYKNQFAYISEYYRFCSANEMKIVNTLNVRNVQFLKVKWGGTYSHHLPFKR